MGQVVVVGLDTAKSVFLVHGVARADEGVVRRRLRRSRVLPFCARVEPCRIGMHSPVGITCQNYGTGGQARFVR